MAVLYFPTFQVLLTVVLGIRPVFPSVAVINTTTESKLEREEILCQLTFLGCSLSWKSGQELKEKP